MLTSELIKVLMEYAEGQGYFQQEKDLLPSQLESPAQAKHP